MMEFFNSIARVMKFSFVQRALIVGGLIALCTALLGVTLVLKRYSLVGDALSHVAFTAACVASLLHLTNDMLFALPITVLCAVLLLRRRQNSRTSGDSVTAMISVGALALGYLIMQLFSGSSNVSADVCKSLFGSTSILTLKTYQLWTSVGMTAFVLVFFVLFYNKIFAITFDESFARACGTHDQLYNLMLSVVIGVVVVMAMNLVGSLLVSALIVFPAVSAMQLFKSFRSVTICSTVMSVITSLLGILISAVEGTPVGCTIVAVDVVVFVVFWVIRVIKGGVIRT